MHMLIKRLLAIQMVLICLFLLIPAERTTAAGDSIRIASVSPDAFPNYNDPVTFSVTINYTLQSADEGIVYLGFNTDQADVHSLVDDSVVVSKGSGTVTLTGTVTPVGWGTPSSPSGAALGAMEAMSGKTFSVYANLSKYPHTDSWEALAYDIMPLKQGIATHIAVEAPLKVGDYAVLGKYYDESILWRCVDINENGALLLSDRILCLKAYDAKGDSDYHYVNSAFSDIRKETGSNCWEDSTLRQWLNSSDDTISWTHDAPIRQNILRGYNAYADEAGFLSSGNFSDYELSAIKPVTRKVYVNSAEVIREMYDGGNSQISRNVAVPDLTGLNMKYEEFYYRMLTDKMFIPGPEEIYSVYKNLDAAYVVAKPTTKAINNSDYKDSLLNIDANYSYWLNYIAGGGYSYQWVNLITPDGEMGVTGSGDVEVGEAYYGANGIRPAFYLDASAVFSSGNGSTDNPYILSGNNNTGYVYVDTLTPTDSARYTGNEGDSFISKVGTRNGNRGLNGTTYQHGLEVWVARWNFQDEISWVWNEYALNQRYISLLGTLTVSDSCYNKDSFDTTIEIRGDGKVLFSETVYGGFSPVEINIDVAGVKNLRISAKDNTAKRGGTSFLLGELRLMPGAAPDDMPIDDSYNAKSYSCPFYSGMAAGAEHGQLSFSWGNEFFASSSLDYNHKLAVASSALCALAYDGSDGKTANIFLHSALHQLDFSDIEMYNYREFSASYNAGSADAAGYTFARKRIMLNGEITNLIAVIVRGTENDKKSEEWRSNFNIGQGGAEVDHYGFMMAAAELYDNLDAYTGKLGPDANNKILITGHSRGAAIANLIAAWLGEDRTIANQGDIYAYTFATPNVTTKEAAVLDELNYAYIHNIVNPEDFVPILPLSRGGGWGFWKYGTTYALPSPGVTDDESSFREMMEKFHGVTGQTYKKYPDRYNAVQNLARILFELAPSVNDYNNTGYTLNYQITGDIPGGGVTLKQYFQNIIVPAITKEEVIAPAFTFSGDYGTITQFFASNTERITCAHAPETYFSWLSVMDADDLVEWDELPKNLYVRIACPVDVEIYNSWGVLVGKTIDSIPDESLFGETTIYADMDVKHVYFSPYEQHTIRLIGIGDGVMEVSISQMDMLACKADREVGAEKVFANVSIFEGKQMAMVITGAGMMISDLQLLVVDDKGIPIFEICADGTEVPLIGNVAEEPIPMISGTPPKPIPASIETPSEPVSHTKEEQIDPRIIIILIWSAVAVVCITAIIVGIIIHKRKPRAKNQPEETNKTNGRTQ